MIRGHLMLDTSVCIEMMRPPVEAWPKRLRDLNASTLCVSSITVAELAYGAENSKMPEERRAELVRLLRYLQVSDFDRPAAHKYGEVRLAAKRAGQMTGTIDMLIGAHARSLGVGVATLDKRDFTRIPGLHVEVWKREGSAG